MFPLPPAVIVYLVADAMLDVPPNLHCIGWKLRAVPERTRPNLWRQTISRCNVGECVGTMEQCIFSIGRRIFTDTCCKAGACLNPIFLPTSLKNFFSKGRD